MEFPKDTKIGLEVHLQVNTGKLYCSCESEGKETGESFIRNLHASSGESGLSDVSTLYEESRERIFKYLATNNSCLVECDEEPPHRINQKALNTALRMASSFGSQILDRIVVMRKVVIDGSNTSGFQRTALISFGGEVKRGDHRSKISTICLEEDACRKVEEDGNTVTYSLDRLGIPLIEISTEPDITSPEGAIEIAREIGERLISIGLLRKGADSIRQDVNFSMGYGRVEIKGVSKLNAIAEILRNEMSRQTNLSKAVEIWKSRGGTEPISFVANNSIFNETNSRMILNSRENGKDILLAKLKNGKGLLKNGDYRFGKEIADALKQIGIKGILHYDELPAYGITKEEKERVCEFLDLEENDSFLILLEEEANAKHVEEVINRRIEKLLSGDFSETRAAMEDNTTRFMRPLSGSSRMYPETDIPVIEISTDMMENARKNAPLPLEDVIRDMASKYGISQQDASTLIWSNSKDLFEEMSEKGEPKMICRILVQKLPELERKKNIRIDNATLRKVFDFCLSNNYGRYSIERALELISEGNDAENILTQDFLKPVDEEELIDLLREIQEKKNISAIGKEVVARTGRPVDSSLIAKALEKSIKK
ncbi:Glu-tRNA(Gln) amidotransferase subunit GatE [Cuniculiplasma sp. SKW3]|uniref:Glu-tRNA(Gln) amidotransferase subunit GatE n=1 Tax=Cuniculiplasma sp. SKW3 TaxID=3400170 RepID=UPI003FD5E54C